jgi:site-specific recombinase XerD
MGILEADTGTAELLVAPRASVVERVPAEGLHLANHVQDGGLPMGPLDHHPVAVYLASLAPGSRRTMRQALDVIAAALASGADAMTLSWSRVTYAHVAAVRARLGATYAATTANKMLAALKGVLRQAFALGLMGAETFTRCLTVKAVRGSRVQRGRALSQDELRVIFRTCDTTTAGGARNAALLALAYSAGLRRSEIVSIDLDDYNERAGTILIRGKGAKERVVYVTSGLRAGLRRWLELRGTVPGPLFVPVDKTGRIAVRRMTDQAIYDLVGRLACRAKVEAFSPHDLRRSFVGDLLDAGADLATVQALAAHASIATTAGYDRRGERARRKAAELVQVPIDG